MYLSLLLFVAVWQISLPYAMGIFMASNDFILKVRAAYNQFTKAEKKVADYIMKHPKEVLFMSITDLADVCKVGDTSVYRFCRTMKLQGYQEFKMKMSLGMSEGESDLESDTRMLCKGDDFSIFAQNTMQKHINALNETYALLEKEEFYKVVTMFEEAEKVYFYGVGDSLLTALEARNKFMRITNKVDCISDSKQLSFVAKMRGSKDMLIAISFSGATKDTIGITKTAKELGMKIACITRFTKSPLSVYCDAMLLCGVNEGPFQGGSLSSKISKLYLIDLLYSEYYRRNHEMGKANKEKTTRAVVDKLM